RERVRRAVPGIRKLTGTASVLWHADRTDRCEENHDALSEGEHAVGVDSGVVAESVRRLVATAQNGLDVLRFGGLDPGSSTSPYQVIERTPMYRLRRYF